MSEIVEQAPAAKKGAVIVGGVGEGLGFAVAARFAAAGHPVVMLARSAENLAPLTRKIQDLGGLALGRATDLRDEEQVVTVFEDVRREFGQIDAAIYNAGAQHRKPMLEITGSMFEKVWRLGCFGAFVFGREAVRHMLPAGRGTVLFTGATASMRGGAEFTAFAAAKFGVRAIAQSMAREFGPRGIHVASIAIAMAVSTCQRSIAATPPPANGSIGMDCCRRQPSPRHTTRFTCSIAAHGINETELRPFGEKF